MRGKNDAAEALCEAMNRPTMRFVPVKSADQQAALMLVGMRERTTNPTGRGLDCRTPHLVDACGVLIFDRIEGDWKLTRAEGVDLPGADHVAAIGAMLGDNVDTFLRSDVEIAYHPE